MSHDEMKDLSTGVDDKVVEGLQNKIKTYEDEIKELKNILEAKDEELANLAKSTDAMSSELDEAKTKMTGLESNASELDKLNTEIYDLKKTISLKDDEFNKFKGEAGDLKPKIEELTSKHQELTDKHEELKKSLTEKENKIQELSTALTAKEDELKDQKSKLEKAETELTDLKPVAPTQYTSEDRLTCPSCGAVGKDIKAEEDKTKILSYVGHTPMYVKKNVCKKCGYEF